MAQRPGPGYPSPPESPEPIPATSRRAWGKVPYEERFRRQRRDLLDAAAVLAAEHGVAGTSVASITSAAGLAKRVFYEHFADKEACFVEVFRAFGAEYLRFALDTAAAAGDRSAPETVRAATVAQAATAVGVDFGGHVTAALNGDQITRDGQTPLATGDTVFFLSADAGG